MTDDVLKTAHEEYTIDKDAWAEIYQLAKSDLEFLSDKENAQWDQTLLLSRKNRPIYQVDQLSQFIHQVSNDIRMNTPSIDIIPDDEGSDVETAEVLQGIIRGIEYKSKADAAYDTAVDFAIRSSIGFIRVDHGFAKDKGYEQELKILRVVNPSSCLIDSNSTEPDGSDAMRGFAFEDFSISDFEKKWPGKSHISFGETVEKKDRKTDKVTIAEYFKIVDTSEEHGLLEDGESEPVQEGKQYKTTRKISKRTVKRYKLSGDEILEETTFPGKYVPIVPVYGEEAWIEGKRHLYSLIRKAKSSQQMFNLGVSLDIEILMKQPQASFMAAAGQVSGFEHEYADPAKANVLHYNVEDIKGNKLGAPQRIQSPQSTPGFINLSREAIDNIKSTLGMYNASLGQKSNETSGIAIQRRNQESDVGNYHFGDNLVRSVTHVGQILVCARGEIMDTPRAVKMIDKEDNAKMIGINGHRVEGQERDFNLKEGDYGVRVTTGPSYTTQRQEAAATYQQLIQAMPDLMPVIGDLVFKYQDSAGSQAISARLKKIVDPKLLSKEEKDKDEPDPQVTALQQQLDQTTQAAQQTIQQLQQELNDKQDELRIKALEAQNKTRETDIKAFQAEQQAAANSKEMPIVDNTADIAVQQRKLDIDEYKAKQEMRLKELSLLLDVEKLKLDAIKTQPQNNTSEENNEDSQDEQQNAVLTAIMQNIAALTQAIQSPITVIRDEAGMITGAV